MLNLQLDILDFYIVLGEGHYFRRSKICLVKFHAGSLRQFTTGLIEFLDL
jgi:hypothetical protein